MPTAADLQNQMAEIQRRTAAPAQGVFSVFNIGTGHVGTEINNTIAALGADCSGRKQVNDGPTGALGNLQGWGMNDARDATINAIARANPVTVNMTGHSRGAILCHMLAHTMFNDPGLRHIKINMIVLDPVHQSKMKHEGAEQLDDNPNLRTYTSIVMENEDKKIMGGAAFPYKFVAASDDTAKKMHHINMPGKHGSGSQQMTSPVGAVCYELIANFMRARGTAFTAAVATPADMAEMFAQIHMLNPASVDGARRMLFDDGGNTGVHNPASQAMHSSNVRAADIAKALQLNAKTAAKPGQKVLPPKPVDQYFFNQEHAFYFKCVCPYFFKVLAAAPGKTALDQGAFERDFDALGQKPGLAGSFALLAAQLNSLLL